MDDSGVTKSEAGCPRCARGRGCNECAHRDIWDRIQKLPKPEGAVSAEHLLSDEQVQGFIRDGYLLLPPELGAWYHDHIHRRCGELEHDAPGRNPGNNFLAELPELVHLLQGQRVRGALQSLLGEDYVMDGHRYCHPSGPGRVAQQWHKDATASGYTRRLFKTGRVMLMYYPQKVLLEHGPTGIVEGSQYCSMHDHLEMLAGSAAAKEVCDDGRVVPDPPAEWGAQRAVTTPGPGWCILIHFDLWHRGMGNTTPDYCRFMLKFQFYRTSVPQAPSWRHTSINWRPPAAETTRPPLLPVWLAVWRWMLGAEEAVLSKEDFESRTSGVELEACLRATHRRVPCLANHECIGLAVDVRHADPQSAPSKRARFEPTPPALEEVPGIQAAFELAKSAEGRAVLFEAVKSGETDSSASAAARRASDALALLPPSVVTPDFVSQMLEILQKADAPRSRLHAAYILGEWAAAPTDKTRSALTEITSACVQACFPEAESNGRVREAAVATVGILSALPDSDGPELLTATARMLESETLLPAQPAIALALLHIQRSCKLPDDVFSRCADLLTTRKDRYAWTLQLELLQRHATASNPQLQALFRCLMFQRWCPLTDAKSPY